MSKKKHMQRVGALPPKTQAPSEPATQAPSALDELDECLRMYEHSFTSDCAARIRRVRGLIEDLELDRE